MERSLLDILVCPGTEEKLELEEAEIVDDEVISGCLYDKCSGKRYPIIGGVPIFSESERLRHADDNMGYACKKDVRAHWKNVIRRYPLVTRLFQFLFDPAYVSRSPLSELLEKLGPDSLLLNVGSGVKKFTQVTSVNLDIESYGNVDVVGDGKHIPFAQESFNAVILEYVIEHIPNPAGIREEVYRILKPGGYIYVTVPFMQAYHGNPDDYYRFTQSGLQEFWNKFSCVECNSFGGPTSALVCLIKEYLSILLSFNNQWLYSIFSQLFILPLFPLKYIDIFLAKTKNAHNIAFSFVYVGQKSDN